MISTAATKWNFARFEPGLVGGHCIGVDPYYLTYVAEQAGHRPQVILAGRRVNDAMGSYVAERTAALIRAARGSVERANVLVLGFAFKENVADVRNTRVADIVHARYGHAARSVRSSIPRLIPMRFAAATDSGWSTKPPATPPMMRLWSRCGTASSGRCFRWK